MTKFKENYYLGLSAEGFHRLCYREWGRKTARHTVVCVHGLTRIGRDFDPLAAELSKQYRVICPDVVGRGKSDWLKDHRNYNFLQYCADMNALLARLEVEEVHWVGTSMGGLIGLMLSAVEGTPVRSLVLNDVGPELRHSELLRLGSYVGRTTAFDDFESLTDYYSSTYSGFGDLTRKQWEEMATYSSVERDGQYHLHYDPKLGDAFRSSYSFMHFNLWKYWNTIKCPTLTFRGERSSFLTPVTVRKMKERGPGTECIEVPNVGHAPMLNSKSEIQSIKNFIAAAIKKSELAA